MTPTPDPIAGWYLILIGVAIGSGFVAVTGYLTTSPSWLRWALLGSAILMLLRYVAMAVFALSLDPPHWAFQRCWFASSIGLTFPAVVAVDHLVRHPAMTPKKLVRLYAPFLAAYLFVLVAAPMQLGPDPVVGFAPTLLGWGRLVLSVTQSVFVLSLAWIIIQLARKLPSAPIRIALVALLAAYLYLAIDGVVLAARHWYFRPFLFSEIIALLSLWWAFETARCHTI